MRNYLKYHQPGVQFVVFMGFAAAMFLIYRFIMQAFFGDVMQALTVTDHPISAHALSEFRWAQFISSVMTFILPAFLYAYLSDEQPLTYLGFKKHSKLIIFLAVIFLLLAVEPFAIYMGQLNQHVNFGPDQQKLQELEKVYENAMNNFVRMSTPYDLVINIFIVALVPAISEELFFRASLQNILERWTRRPWIAILLSSFAFAFLHLTVFKFLGILTLGIALGILFYVTRNILYNIFFHFLNNAISLLVTYYAGSSVTLKKISSDDVRISVFAAAASLLVTIAIFVFIRRRSPYQPLHSQSSKANYDVE